MISKIISGITAFLVSLIGSISFILSYSTLQAMAVGKGIPGKLSYIWPLLIDFSLIVFSLAVVNSYLQGKSGFRQLWKEWGLVAIYTIATVWFNIAHERISTEVVFAIAPISLFFSFEILMSQLKDAAKRFEIAKSFAKLDEDLQLKIAEIEMKIAETEEINLQIAKSKTELESLKVAIEDEKTVQNNSIAQAREVKIAKVDQRRNEILQTVLQNKEMSLQELSEKFDISERTIRDDLKSLQLCKNGNGWEIAK